ncbi:MAG: protein translocase subunit SecD [Treponema sp.]|nr:protein translocase subunit SecD [Treponema sp.]
MKKRYRFGIVILVLAVCFVFLWPSLSWHFLTSRDQQARALQTREQIRNQAMFRAEADYQRLLDLARAGGDVPEDLAFLTREARRLNRENGLPSPAVWDAHSTLAAFPSAWAVRDAIETQYRDEVFALRNLQRQAVQLGLDLSGGLSIVLQADMAALQERLDRSLTEEDRNDAMERTLQDLNSRIDQFGLTEPVIRRQGPDQIYVEIPGSADPERINDIIMGRGSLTFHIVDDEATAAFNLYYRQNPFTTFDANGNLAVDHAAIPIPADVVIRGVYEQDRYGLNEQQRNADGTLRFSAIRREVGLDGTHIRSALVERDQFGRPEVTFILTPEGGDIFWQLTSANIQRPMAIVLDDRVRSQATIQGAIRDRVRLTGFGFDEANSIAMMLRTAGLPVTLEVVSQQSIGASMGEDTIRQGLFALLGGVALVLVFMLVYYRSAGINAVVAQLLNFYIMFSVLSAFSFTLTLPSIAGFILTIGMATDANVIIFERIKEELRLGKGRKAAVEIGFGKAFWAVMDSNVTTFIAALFLAQLGSGPIQGFAVALSVGVFSSVFTALFVSRLIFDFGSDVLGSKKIRITWSRPRAAREAVGGIR